MADAHLYRYKVQMTCGGCSGAVERALKKATTDGVGIDQYKVDLTSQTVLVEGPVSQADLTAKISKTGKKILEEEDLTGKGETYESLVQAIAVA
ncbi:hypothetical protein SCHPADRAFT_289055 [Schizopora paradoxa]|uniref:HMA domain-containing protein n=1 Tax=Schizopora paradoxa TaxID=27342 RepID=A0A0H2RTC5_9AGAM|nr:hypothetical protein SCHPADRAFT_289055 [Schizopora paradoxa]